MPLSGLDVERVRFNQPYYDNARGTFTFQRNWTNHSIGDTLLGLLQSTTRNAETTRNYLRPFSLGSYSSDDYKVTVSLLHQICAIFVRRTRGTLLTSLALVLALNKGSYS